MAVTLTEKGQITIPLAVRKRLKPGRKRVFDDSVPSLKAVRVVDAEPMRRALGCLNTEANELAQSLDSAALIDAIRGAVDE